MANATFSASRRRNVKPASSTLHVQTRDVDASGLTYAPEDGEFILISGSDPANPAAAFHAADHAGLNAAAKAEGPLLRMVWGSAARSDRQVLDGKRTTVFMHGPGIDLDVALFVCPDEDSSLDASANFPIGTLLGVEDATAILENVAGDVANKRLILSRFLGTGWCVGYVRESVSGVPSNGSVIKIHLYGTPRYIGAAEGA